MNKSKYLLTLIYAFIALDTLSATQQVSLRPLQCDESDVLSCNVGIRPYRKGGIRLETENLEDKVIIHNYGHGGSGATLAPGSVERAVSLFEMKEPDHKKVSILGCGYMGLLTAERLVAAGYKVTVYADQFPTQDYFYKDGKACITSLVAGGLWFPLAIDSSNQDLIDALRKDSYRIYSHKIEQEEPGVSFRTAYSFPTVSSKLYPEELAPPEEVEVTFGKGYHRASKWSSIFIDGNFYLNSLYRKLSESENLTFKDKKFTQAEEVLALNDTFIFNCTGYGAKTIFDDEAIKPIRGQLLYLRPQPQVDYFLSGDGATSRFYVIPSFDKVIVGGTFERGEETCQVQPETIDSIRLNVSSFFNDKI